MSGQKKEGCHIETHLSEFDRKLLRIPEQKTYNLIIFKEVVSTPQLPGLYKQTGSADK